MEPSSLIRLSIDLEDRTGYDSIKTIQDVYQRDGSRYLCPWPECNKSRTTPLAMWRHIHFSKNHGYSFGVPWMGSDWKARLQAIADGDFSRDRPLCVEIPPETTPAGTPGTPKSSQEHTG